VLPQGASLGLDIGESCNLGKPTLLQSTAYKYCVRIWGSPPAVLVWNNPNDFTMCKYFTHSITAIIGALGSDADLFDDGTTAGGCVVNTVPPKDTKACPHPSDGLYALAIAIVAGVAWIIVHAAAIAALVCCHAFKCGIFRDHGCFGKRYKDSAERVPTGAPNRTSSMETGVQMATQARPRPPTRLVCARVHSLSHAIVVYQKLAFPSTHTLTRPRADMQPGFPTQLALRPILIEQRVRCICRRCSAAQRCVSAPHASCMVAATLTKR
jgi:hypothetical protein